MKLFHSYLPLPVKRTEQGCCCRSHASLYRSMPAGVNTTRRSAGQAHNSKGLSKAEVLNSARVAHGGILKQKHPHKVYAGHSVERAYSTVKKLSGAQTTQYCSKRSFLPEVSQTVGVQKVDAGCLDARLLDLHHKSVMSLPIRNVCTGMTSTPKVQQTFSNYLPVRLVSRPGILLNLSTTCKLSPIPRLIHVSSSRVQCQCFHLFCVNSPSSMFIS